MALDIETRIKNLETELASLKRATLPFLANQRGPIPGALNATRIGPGGNTSSSIFMNLDGNVAGVAPRISVTDTNGIVRAEMGNLAALGNSPAQYGFRATDSLSNPIFDSLGLIAVMKTLGSVLNFSQNLVTGNGSYQTVSGSTVSFTLTRATNVLVLASGLFIDPTVGDTGFNLQLTVLIDGVQNNANGPVFVNDLSSGLSMTPFAVLPGLAAGAHTAALGANQTSGKLWSLVNGYLYVFSLGA